MEIHLVRHTKPKNVSGICYGHLDVDLESNYIKAIQKIQLNQYYDYALSSPLIRCVKLIENKVDKYETDDRLKEMNFGDWEGKNWNEIDSNDIQPWYDDFVHQPTKNGESFMDLNRRVIDLIEELQTKDYLKVLIVTHAGVIRIFLHYILQFPLENAFQFSIDYGSITKIQLNPIAHTILSVNQTF